MNTITRIRELDTYLVTFMDQNTIYNYGLLSKGTNRIMMDNELFRTLKEYYETHHSREDILQWAIRNDKPHILDWYDRLGYKFKNSFVIINKAIMNSSTKIMNWFYQKGMFDYALISLHWAVHDGSFGSVDWFYGHGLEKTYLDKLLSETTKIISHILNHVKLLRILKWLHKKNYPIELDIQRISRNISDGSMELINWLLDNKLIDKLIFAMEQYSILFDMKKIPVEKQLVTLTLFKKLDYHFKEGDIESLMHSPTEVMEWCMANIRHIRLENIFILAASANKISIMKWTGIDKNHPNFDLLDHRTTLVYAIRRRYMDVIDWYFEMIPFDIKILGLLYIEFGSILTLSVEIVMQFEKYFNKYNYSYEQIYPKLVECAFERGNLAVVEYLFPKLLPKSIIRIYAHDVSNCIANGNIEVLKWLEKYLHQNINAEPNEKSVQVLYFEDNNDFTCAIDSAAYRARHPIERCHPAPNKNYLETIKWAKYFFPHKFNYKDAIDNAAFRYHIDILNWFDKSFDHNEFKYSTSALDISVINEGIRTFKWFESSGHPLKYTNRSIEDSIYSKKIDVLQWLKDNQYPMTFTPKSIYVACVLFSESLQWLKDNGVIKILDREMVNGLLVFKIELAQPFLKSARSNAEYGTTDYVMPYNFFFEITNEPAAAHETRIIEISFKYDKINNISVIDSDILLNEHYDICCSLHWFERQYKLAIH